MDDVDNLPEVERSERGGENLRVGSEQPAVLTTDDLFLLQLHDTDQVKDIIERYSKLDIPRENVELFKQHLLQRVDSFFVQVDDVGLIYLTNIVPTFTGNLQVMFWDKKFGKVRRELVKRVIATAIAEFQLTRVQAFVPETNVQLCQVELRKIGFTLEGTLRRAWREGSDCSMLIFGLLKEETTAWESVAHLTISLEAHT